MDTNTNLKKTKQETERTTKNIVKTYPKNQQIFQVPVSTNVVWFFHFKRICNPDFDIVKFIWRFDWGEGLGQFVPNF
jgi:hypothetical protein